MIYNKNLIKMFINIILMQYNNSTSTLDMIKPRLDENKKKNYEKCIKG